MSPGRVWLACLLRLPPAYQVVCKLQNPTGALSRIVLGHQKFWYFRNSGAPEILVLQSSLADAAIEQDNISGEGLAGLSPEVAASVAGH